MFKVYWRINKKKTVIGTYKTEEEAYEAIRNIIDTKSTIKSYYWNSHFVKNKQIIDYGAHNASFHVVKTGEQVEWEV